MIEAVLTIIVLLALSWADYDNNQAENQTDIGEADG